MRVNTCQSEFCPAKLQIYFVRLLRIFIFNRFQAHPGGNYSPDVAVNLEK
jgi:hypothetical protein